jgi:signal peptidase II
MADTAHDGGGGDLEQRTAQDTTGTASPASGRPRWALFLGLAAAVVVADQITKAWVLANVPPGGAIPVFGDLVRLVLSANTGALFGLFRDQATLFAVVSVGVIGLIAWYHGRSPRSLLLSLALGLLLGGAIGNLIDRVRLGYVVDFVDAGLGGLRFYTFNVADSAISAALLLLILLALRPEPSERPSPTAMPSGTSPGLDRGADA